MIRAPHHTPLPFPSPMERPAYFMCHLYYRPLREGSGDGHTPPWTLETFDDTDAAALEAKHGGRHRGGPARDALSDLASGGGRWLAMVAHSDARDFEPPQEYRSNRILGESIVCEGNVLPLRRWFNHWPVSWWESSIISGAEMLAPPDLPIDLRWRAAVAFVRATVESATLYGMKLDATQWLERASAMERCAEANLSSPERDVAQVEDAFGSYLAELRRMCSIVRQGGEGGIAPGELFDLDEHRAKITAWDRTSASAIRRIVGDAWFIARAAPSTVTDRRAAP